MILGIMILAILIGLLVVLAFFAGVGVWVELLGGHKKLEEIRERDRRQKMKDDLLYEIDCWQKVINSDLPPVEVTQETFSHQQRPERWRHYD